MTLTIIPHEKSVSVFAINLSDDEVENRRKAGGAAAGLLGVDQLDPSWAEIVKVDDLTGIGLTGYLTDGYDIEDSALAGDRGRLNALDGHVLVLSSRAFTARTEITPGPELRHIGTYAEPQDTRIPEAPISEAAEGILPGPTTDPAAAQRLGSGPLAAIIIVAVLVVVAVLWMLV